MWRHLVSEVSMRGDHGWVGNVNLPIVVFFNDYKFLTESRLYINVQNFYNN